ncbi:MAG TPA: TetR/AcrR family transcriptional regulator [Spirochaetales bacterium]|nr:TetR/AcrR family transcriptional regulator [Spirochaetales bacterium]HPG85148.1 TetR/AcrR family transcriptional regulator [Spirochaetales bacterium]
MVQRGADTQRKLVETAIALFASRWYSSISVAEICRAAELSNGVFYRYFPNKEAIFFHILDDVIVRIAAALERTEGGAIEERIRSMTEILVSFSAEHPDLITVFREGQYRYFEYERRLTETYRRILSKTLGRPAGVAEYLVGIGGPRFAAVRSALQGANISTAALADMAANGLFPGLDWDPERVFGITIAPPAIRLEESSRDRLMKAGKRLFGERGFHAVNIHEVTDAAGLSVGAFYKHFDSKESFFREQIASAGKEVRHFIASNLTPGLNRLEEEMQGMFLFGVYLSLDRWCYNIAREGEFVALPTVKEYYAAFKRGYERLGAAGMDQEAVASDPLYLDSAAEFMMGLSHYYGLEVAFDESPHNARAIVEGVGEYLSHGLARRS